MAATNRHKLMAEWAGFASNIGPDVRYDRLVDTGREAGWVHRLEQSGVLGLPDGSVIVTFDLYLGHDYEVMERIDSMSYHLSSMPGPVTFAAAVQMDQTIIHKLFGRMPPLPPQQAQDPVEQTIDASEGEDDIVLPDLSDEDRGFPEADEYVPPAAPEPLDIIDHREPDGVPIFKDLYSVGGPDLTADVVIAAVMEVIKPFSIKVSSKEELLALYTKNPDLNQFMIDFGTPEERLELKTVLDRALARLSEKPREVRIPGGTGSPGAAPRRRVKG